MFRYWQAQLTGRQEEAIRKALELQLHAGELIAQKSIQSIGLIDRNTGNTKMYLNGIVSKNAMEVTFDRMREWGIARAFPLDADRFDKQFELHYIEAEIKKNGSCIMTFRQIDDGQ